MLIRRTTVRTVIGIDTGRYGALAVLDVASGALLAIYDMPIDMVQDGETLRSVVNGYRLHAILHGYADVLVVVEEPEGFPIVTRDRRTGQPITRQPSARNLLSWGKQAGTITGVVCALGYAYRNLKPKAWKQAASVPSDKTMVRQLARERFPAFTAMFSRVKDDGRADAVMIALYGRSLILAGKG